MLAPVVSPTGTNDATMEKMHDMMEQSHHGIGLVRDETHSLIKRWERDENANERGFVLQSWNGYGSYELDRVGRVNVLARNLCLTVIGGIQPDRLMPVIAQALSQKQDDGLIQRWQLMVMPDEILWKSIDRAPDVGARSVCEKIFLKLSELTTEGAEEIHKNIAAVSRFTTEAQIIFNDFQDTLRRLKVPSEQSKIMKEHLIKYEGLMPALALLSHLVECVVNASHGDRFRVCTDCTVRALSWMDYLEAHARRIYGMATSPEALGGKLAGKIKGGHIPSGFTVRDIVQKDWSGLPSSEACEAACTYLEGLAWLRREEQPPGPTGGRPTVKYFINPKLRGK